jgi:hypothetical protein
MNRKALLIVVACTVAAFLSACSSSKPVTIAITTAPPASVEINNGGPVAATVMHDSSNLGVDWTCSPAPCGTFTPAHTASGAPTTWIAGSTAGTVTITAASTKKATVTATASVTVNPVATASNLTGSYAFYLSGFDLNGFFYSAAGSVTLDGAGDVTAGEEDLNDAGYAAPVLDDLLTGTYTVGSDGQGTFVLTATTGGAADPLVGVAGVQTLSFTVVNGNHLRIGEFDANFASTGAMDMQSAAAVTAATTAGFTGNFASVGQGYLSGTPWTFGVVINSAALASTGNGDQNIGGTVTPNFVTGGPVSVTDAMGRGTFTLGGVSFAYYVVGAETVYFTETDIGGVTTGQLFGSGSAPAFSAASITGPYVMSQNWSFDPIGEVTLAGQFTADGVGTSPTSISGVTDYNDSGLLSAGPDTIAGSYTMTATGYGGITGVVVSGDTDFTTYGLYATDPALNLNDPNDTTDGLGGALIQELDIDTIGSGLVLVQSATSLTVVNEAVADNTGQFNATGAGPFTLTGQVASSTTAFAGTLNTNFLDVVNVVSTETSAASVSGTVTADATNVGRYTISATVGGSATPNSFVNYVASGSVAVQVDVDSTATLVQVGNGTIEGQQ